MTTIALTKTHIGSDHCKVSMTKPPITSVDLNFLKLYIDPDNRFIIGVSGIVDMEIFNSEIIRKSLEILIKAILLCSKAMIGRLTNPIILEVYDTLFEDKNTIVLVTKNKRVICERKEENISVYWAGDIVCIGSGGPIASGLLRGGMDIDGIWGHVNILDSVTSEAHTIIPLDILVDWDSNEKEN